MDADFLVIGSGLAGLTFALQAARSGDVLSLSKDACRRARRTTRRAASRRCGAPTTRSRRTSRTRSPPAPVSAIAISSSWSCARGRRASASSSRSARTSRAAISTTTPNTISAAKAATATAASSTPPTPPAARSSARWSRRCAASRTSACSSATSPSICSPTRRCDPAEQTRRRAAAPTCSTRDSGEVQTVHGARDAARHRRRRQGLPLHVQPRHRDRRRRRHGLPRRRADRQHGVHPVPPHLPLPPARPSRS